jgi:thioredoxin-related protein
VFGATKRKFSDITFQEIDLDDESTRSIGQKYAIGSIPRVVFLDASGNVLFNGGPQREEDSFAAQIGQYH